MPDCERVLACDPGNDEAHQLLGISLSKLRRSAEAESHLRKALEINPQSPRASLLLGRLLVEMSTADDAVQSRTKIARLSEAAWLVPESFGIWITLGQALMREGEAERASAVLSRATALMPGNRDAHHLLARALLQLSRHSAAEWHFRLAYREVPQSADAAHNLGMTLHQQRRYFEAEPWFRRAAALSPDQARHVAFVSNCMLWTGRFSRALNFIDLAIAINPRADYIQSRTRILVNLKAVYDCHGEAGRRPMPAPPAAPGPLGAHAPGRRMLAFVRHMNDLDHLLPVISAWTGQDDGADVVLVDAEAPDGDFRMSHLRNRRGVAVHRLHDILDQHCDDPFGRLMRALAPAGRPAVVVNAHDATEIGPIIHQAAARVGLAMVTLPNNEAPLVNRLIYADSTVSVTDVDLSADHIVYSHSTARSLAGAGRAVGRRIHVLGSARYSSQWLAKLDRLLPRDTLPAADERLKVVLFLISEKFAISWPEVRETIRLLLSLPGIHLLVSRHTRAYRLMDLAASEMREKGHATIEPDATSRHPSSALSFANEGTPGAALVAWGDVFLSVATSISVEPIMRNKPLLELSYLHSNYALVARELKVCDMRCRDQLVEWMKRFLAVPRDGLGSAFYDAAERRNFVDQFVELDGQPPIDRYMEVLHAACARVEAAT